MWTVNRPNSSRYEGLLVVIIILLHRFLNTTSNDLTCKRGSVGQSEGLSIPRSSVRFRLKPDNSNSHEFELYRPSNKGTKLLLKVIKAIIINSLGLDLKSLDSILERVQHAQYTLLYINTGALIRAMGLRTHS